MIMYTVTGGDEAMTFVLGLFDSPDLADECKATVTEWHVKADEEDSVTWPWSFINWIEIEVREVNRMPVKE
jgi:hypothetical protein